MLKDLRLETELEGFLEYIREPVREIVGFAYDFRFISAL